MYDNISHSGEVAERPKAAVLKTVNPIWVPGFESLSLHNALIQLMISHECA